MFIQLLYLLFVSFREVRWEIGYIPDLRAIKEGSRYKKHTKQTKSSLCLYLHLANDFQANSLLMRAQQFFSCVYGIISGFMVQTNNND